ncbi:MAG TPA: polyprenyl diphosphate synthase [Thermoplasmata archaeon]|nr:polyprenyl diphosphate synthase [Thermoplasmata archaeon]
MGEPAPASRRRDGASLSHAVGDALRDLTEKRLAELVRGEPVPRHLAIIMDGNRRFAAREGLDVKGGHAKGRDTLEELLDWCLDVGIRILTVYALSTENLSRPKEELEGLMELFDRSLREIATDERVHRHKIRVRVFGNRTLLPSRVQEAIALAETATEAYTEYRYNVALGYGGREEIVDAIRALAREVQAGTLDPAAIDSETVSRHLYTADLPDPDLIFRTSGEERISNFLLWQSAYSELYFSDVLWPGLTRLEFLRAIRSFQVRRRRYGE